MQTHLSNRKKRGQIDLAAQGLPGRQGQRVELVIGITRLQKVSVQRGYLDVEPLLAIPILEQQVPPGLDS